MKRGGFFKSLLALAVSPSIVKEIDFDKKKAVSVKSKRGGEIFSHVVNVYGIVDTEVVKWEQLNKK